MDSLVYFAVLSLCAVLFRWLYVRSKPSAPLPPGPPADFLLGHARIFPREEPQVKLAEWAKKYGDVMHFNILGKNLIILSSQTATYDLLEKRGSIYSSRPRFPAFELAGWAHQPAFMPYSKDYLKYQKWFQHGLGARAAAGYQPIQLKHCRALLKNLFATPDDLPTHVTRFADCVVVEVAYGADMVADSRIERHIELVEEVTRKLAAMGDTSFLDLLPFLIYFPSWLPGLGGLATARGVWKVAHELEYSPFTELRRRVAEGRAYPALVAAGLETLEREGRATNEELDFLRISGTVTVGAGSETTWSTIMNFIAMMLLFPHVQDKAQEEIDRVIGRDRLPDFSDRDSLPFVQCVVYETMRWHPAVPLAIPHLNMTDDVYDGMFIPKGSTIIANANALAFDERVYKNPKLFFPERFLPEHGEPVPTNIAFGHGRRICPGRHLADASLWIAIASLLTAFEIRPVLDSKGNEVPPNIKFTTALTSHPEPFPCRLIPRSSSLIEYC